MQMQIDEMACVDGGHTLVVVVAELQHKKNYTNKLR